MLAAEYTALPNGPIDVGWDGSAGATKAFAAAGRLFPERDLLLVCVDEGANAAATPADLPAAVSRQVHRLNVDRARGFHIRAISDALIACAYDQNVAVVVVGSRGRSAAQEILLGSVAMGTLHHSHRPVMVVPTGLQPATQP